MIETNPKGERRCAVGVGPNGEPIFEQFVRLKWADADHAVLMTALDECIQALKAIKDATVAAMAQGQSGVPTGENVPRLIQEAMNKIAAALSAAKKASASACTARNFK